MRSFGFDAVEQMGDKLGRIQKDGEVPTVSSRFIVISEEQVVTLQEVRPRRQAAT